jgi:uncharacterized iron-regulated membrane protein
MRTILTAAAGLVLGAGVLMMAGTASAAQPAGGSACQQLQSTLSTIQSTLPSAASNPGMLKSKIRTYAGQLEQEASSASPSVKSAVGSFVADLQAAASGKANVSKLTADANAIGTACRAQATPPSGAPGTGGGSTAGATDPALFGVGGAAVLAGLGALGLARRNRPRNNTRHG